MRASSVLLLVVSVSACGLGTLATDAGRTDVADAGADAGLVGPVDAGQPLNVPAEQWTWVDFPDSACGNGAPTGIGVNLTGRSTDLLIYLQGGGACWNQYTCYTLGTAAHLSAGYTANDFAGEATVQSPIFSRTDATSPFKNASYVFVPYCTGDLHSGAAVTSYAADAGTHHVGAQNLDAFLHRLTATLPSTTRVWLSGSSAGGYGAQMQYVRVVQAFPQAEVHVLADGAQIVPIAPAQWQEMSTAWNVSLPAACTDCSSDLRALLDLLFTSYPTRRFALLASTQDQTLRTYFQYSAASFAAATQDTLTTKYDPHPNARYFELASSQHTMLGQYPTLVHPTAGVSLKTWISRWATGDPAWANAAP